MSELKKSTQKSGLKTAVSVFAVLVLVSAVCAGVAAAAPSVSNPLFYWENVSGSSGYYTHLDYGINLSNTDVLDAFDEYPGGTYSGTGGSFQLKNMTAQVTMYVLDANNTRISSCINGKVPQGSRVEFHITTDYPKEVGLKFTNPKGTLKGIPSLGTWDLSADSFGSFHSQNNTLDDNLMTGTWTVWAYFKTNDSVGYMVPYAPPEYQNGKPYTFTIVSSSVSMDVDRTEATVGGYVRITVSGKPGEIYLLKQNEKYTMVPNQQNVNIDQVTIGNDGKTVFYIQAAKDGTFTLQLCNATTMEVEQDAELTFTKATITANAKEDSYNIGNDIKLSGTNEKGVPLYYYIDGLNQLFTQIPPTGLKIDQPGENWETTIKGSYINTLNLDTAIYTIYVSTNNATVKDDVLNRSGSSASVAINLVSPELMLTSSPDVVVQGNDLVVKGTAEGNPANVTWYLFGTNLFCFNTTDVGKSGSFIIEKTLDKETFAPGQYYLIVQHPMYDKVFNIGAVKSDTSYQIVENRTGSYHVAPYDVLFDVNDRQTANAAYALSEAINSEDIDDIAVKRSFIVSASQTTVDPIPSQITKGLPFTVSGTSNNENGNTITVELLSNAFTAASKNQATSASYITLIAQPDGNGKWAATFDTSGLNIDTYTINVLDGTSQVAFHKISIVEAGTPVATPTQEATVLPTAATVKPTATAKSPVPLAGILAGLGIAFISCRKRNEP